MQRAIPSSPKAWIFLAFAYAKKHWVFSLIGLYFVGSSILLAATGVDVCIPCLWTAIFDMTCPGCGTTTAFIHILKLQFADAWQANQLVFIIFPAAIGYLFFDIRKFVQSQAVEPSPDVAA